MGCHRTNGIARLMSTDSRFWSPPEYHLVAEQIRHALDVLRLLLQTGDRSGSQKQLGASLRCFSLSNSRDDANELEERVSTKWLSIQRGQATG